MAKKLAGGKFSDKHTTVIDGAFELAKLLETDELVTKIVLAIIRQSKSQTEARIIKMNDIPAGLEIIVKSKRYVQTLYAYIVNPNRNREMVKVKIDGLRKSSA